jgi:cytochrome c-type biogenesis protein CcmE
MITGAIAIFTNMSKDISSYSTFKTAAIANTEVKVVGVLDKSKEMHYNPELNPNEFIFYMKDADEISKKVILSQPKPMEFENAEQLVLTGKFANDVFVASEMLTKCPSKYKNEEIYIKT